MSEGPVIWADLDANLCVVKIISVAAIGEKTSRVYCPALRQDRRTNGTVCSFDRLCINEDSKGWHRTAVCKKKHGKVCIKLTAAGRL
jgi:hypothetical protein